MFTIEYLRSFRLASYAIFDFVVSFLGVYLLSPILSKLFAKIGLKISTQSWLLLTIPSSIVIHYLVGNITPMTENFLDPNGHYLLKIIIMGLLLWGIKGIKKVKN